VATHDDIRLLVFNNNTVMSVCSRELAAYYNQVGIIERTICKDDDSRNSTTTRESPADNSPEVSIFRKIPDRTGLFRIKPRVQGGPWTLT
jgi:hypothetical protein